MTSPERYREGVCVVIHRSSFDKLRTNGEVIDLYYTTVRS